MVLKYFKGPCRVSTHLKLHVNPRLRWRNFRSILKWLLFALLLCLLLCLINFSIASLCSNLILNCMSSLIITKQSFTSPGSSHSSSALCCLGMRNPASTAAHHFCHEAPWRLIASAVCLRKEPSVSVHHGFRGIIKQHSESNNALSAPFENPDVKTANFFPLLTADGSLRSLSVCR